jgi:hypothetical protein
MSRVMIHYDPAVPVGTERLVSDGENVRFVDAERYFRAQVGSVMNVLAVFLNIAPESGLPESLLARLDDAVAEEYWERFDGCLVPPRVERAIRRAAAESPDLLARLEGIRNAILSPSVALEDAQSARVRVRIELLEAGMAGHLGDYPLAVAEAFADMMLLERAAMEDVLRAESERQAGQTRAEIIERMDANKDFAFEAMLPVIIRPQVILERLDTASMARFQAYAARRRPYQVERGLG